MQQKRRVIAVVLITVVILISTFCVWPVIRLNSFYNAESRAVARFDSLNSEVFMIISPPSGVIELDQSSSGVVSPTTTHGRYLITDYQIVQTQPDVVLGHYKKLLLSNGWKETVAYQDYYVYSHGTACVNVSFYGDKYSLNIWHDFWNQDFSPSDPNTWLLKFIEFGESAFAVCPP